MQYIEVSIEDALKFFMGDTSRNVLIAVKDLENKDDTLQRFKRATGGQCRNIIESTKTACHGKDDEIINHLLLFSDKQNICEIKPIGTMTHIIYPNG